MEFDKDLQSIQEIRDLVAAAGAAQESYADYTQEQMDKICLAVTRACEQNLEKLAKMANEETGYGVWQDKVLKNQLGSTMTYDSFKDMKCVGILKEDKEKKLMEVGVPMGVVAALIPSTNPTSTVMYKSLICLKSGNAIIISPHPGALKCIQETYRIIAQAAKAAGAPDKIVQCVSLPTMQGTDALLKHPGIGIILATGGEAMVRAAYSSGNPALGVGPGNGPSFIEKSADIPAAIRRIFDSKTFDNGTICASEQSIVTEACIAEKVRQEAQRQGGYFLNDEESEKVGRFIMRANGTMNPKIVGKPAQAIADMAGITIPSGTRVLISPQTSVGKDNPYSREKLCPILAFYVEENWQSACKRSIEILFNEGKGHTMTIHSQDESVIREFALKKPVSRLLVNTAGALGGVGASTALSPALTLGCGAVGGSATSDNVGPMNLINIRRVAYGIRELEDLRRNSPAPAPQAVGYAAAGAAPHTFSYNSDAPGEAARAATYTREDVEHITRAVIARLNKQ